MNTELSQEFMGSRLFNAPGQYVCIDTVAAYVLCFFFVFVLHGFRCILVFCGTIFARSARLLSVEAIGDRAPREASFRFDT